MEGKLRTLVADVEEAFILTMFLMMYFIIDKDQLNEMGLDVYLYTLSWDQARSLAGIELRTLCINFTTH